MQEPTPLPNPDRLKTTKKFYRPHRKLLTVNTTVCRNLTPTTQLEQEYKTKRYIKWDNQGIEAIANSISLSPLMVNKSIFMSSDASAKAIAGLIWQKDPETGPVENQ